MSQNIVGLYASSRWDAISLLPSGGNLRHLFSRAIRSKANPRNESYMQELFVEYYPAGRFLNVSINPACLDDIPAADVIVLLYPDAIGLWQDALERKVLRLLQPKAELRVLNGRRRNFVLSRETRWALRGRRWLEISMLGELLFMSFFILATPWLLIFDLIRGRR